jgi:hypothetical protein
MSENEDNSNSDEEFEAIISNQPVNLEKESELPYSTLWQAVEQAFPNLHDGIILKGVVLIDFVDKDGDRSLLYANADDTPPWDLQGLLKQAQDDLEAENMFGVMRSLIAMAQAQEDEDDDE